MTSSTQKTRLSPCIGCGRTDTPIDQRITGWQMCRPCTKRRRNHPAPCPTCGLVRVLAFPLGKQAVCTTCAGAPPLFECPNCGEESHPYGKVCARCTLATRATELLTDPATGHLNQQLRPLLDYWINSVDPRTPLRWVSQSQASTDLLRQMACGQSSISHVAFRQLPPTKPNDYLRNLLVSIGILGPWEPHVDRFISWLDTEIAPRLEPDCAFTINSYARWHILRNLHRHASNGTLTQAVANSARIRVRAAIEFCELLARRGVSIEDATQVDLEELISNSPGYNRTKTIASFIAWARKTRVNRNLTASGEPWPNATVTISTEQHWSDVERLLNENHHPAHIRLAGLFTLLFAQPLNRIVAMRLQQIHATETDVLVTFANDPIEMPPILDDLLRNYLTTRAERLVETSDPGWLFPGGQPGRHLVTEVFRRDLTAIGIKPYESRKASMFHLAARIPAPVLAGLLGITDRNAAAWAKLAGRDWSAYIQHRDEAGQKGGIHAI